jgi:hypothetical protein
MTEFSAKFITTSIISYSLDTWTVAAHIVDNRGLFYAFDAALNMPVYFKNSQILKYTVTEITLASGAEFICKLTWAGVGNAVTPLGSYSAFIGNIKDAKYQGLDLGFLAMLKILEPIEETTINYYNIDGGSPETNYTPQQSIDAGGP